MARNGTSLEGKLVVLVGGSGFFGTHLAQELLSSGARLRIASRNPERAFKLKPLAGLGQVQFARCDMTKPESLARVVAGADAVVNLVGAFDGNLDAVQGHGAGTLARLAQEAGAQSFVHVSAIGADVAGTTAYAQSKAAGEAAVLGAFPTATILRPSVLFGPDDKFINMFAGLLAAFPVMPVFGPAAQLQPLFVDDAALAVVAALGNPKEHGGKTYELGGPEVLTMQEINQRIAKAQGRSPLFLPLPDGVSGAFATLTGWLPLAPLTRQQWSLLKAGNVVAPKAKGCKALGIAPRPLSLFLDRWMVRYRKHGRFGDKAAA
ncbi:MAG: complex I NDUFA9 subunit family protein [Sphingomonadaceae bacterium]|nr:complex I NDUFA9 subunit family protein [Sphingomonadaceae bacterium]